MVQVVGVESAILAVLPQQMALLERLVNINSYSANLAGVNLVQQVLADEFQALGLQVRRFSGADAGVGDFLIGETGCVGDTIVASCHADTVHPPDSQFNKFFAEAAKCTGPGVLDMKGGIVVLLGALHALKACGMLGQLPIKILVNPAEETGSEWAREIIRAEAQKAAAALVFEWGRQGNKIITRRKGIVSYEILVTGREAHAGNGHQLGINAIDVLAEVVVALRGLTNYEAQCTLNVGLIEGGSAVNTVPGAARAEFEVRAASVDGLAEMCSQVKKIVGAGETRGARIALREVSRLPVMPEVVGAAEVVESFVAVAAKVGLSMGPLETVVGGGSDANVIAAAGVPTIDGLGPRGDFAHTDREYIELESLGIRTRVLGAWLAERLVGKTGSRN